MPSKNPRLSVVLTPSLAALFSQLAEETGESASSLVRNLLVQSEAPLQRMLALVKAAKQAKAEVGGGLHQSMERVTRDLESAYRLVEARSGDLLSDLVAQAEVVKPRRRAPARVQMRTVGGAPVSASTPVPVTRGSGRQKGPKRGRV